MIIPVGVKADPSLWRNAWTRLGRERRHGQVETYGNWYKSSQLARKIADPDTICANLGPERVFGVV